MPKKGHSEEKILRALHQAESGTRMADICREHGISEATYYIWKKKYSGLGLSELRELRQLRKENAKLKRAPLLKGRALLWRFPAADRRRLWLF